MLVASLLVASFVIFAALYLAPGNPVTALSGGRSLPPSSIAVLEARYHLNEPFLTERDLQGSASQSPPDAGDSPGDATPPSATKASG